MNRQRQTFLLIRHDSVLPVDDSLDIFVSVFHLRLWISVHLRLRNSWHLLAAGRAGIELEQPSGDTVLVEVDMTARQLRQNRVLFKIALTDLALSTLRKLSFGKCLAREGGDSGSRRWPGCNAHAAWIHRLSPMLEAIVIGGVWQLLRATPLRRSLASG